MKRYYLLAGLCLWAFVACGQRTLRVVDRAGGEPIVGATLTFLPTGEVLITDALGEVVFTNRMAGFGGDFRIEALGFEPLTLGLEAVLRDGGRIELTPQDWLLDEVVVSANRQREPKIRVAQPIQVITEAQIAQYNPPTSAEVLEQAGVFIQRSQLGGGSPVIRGFEASRVLLVVDGVRMNNTIYRTGHLQNVISLDPNMLERVEVLYGAGSTLYGSDALGGVMHFVTRTPRLDSLQGGAFLRYGTAARERSGSVWLNLGATRLASLTSITYKTFDDLRVGKWRRSVLPEGFGQKPFTVARIQGVDTMLPHDPDVLNPVGYDQADILQKLRYEASPGLRLTLNLQASTSSDVPRYDAYAELDGNEPAYARWDYGPQIRVLASLQAELLQGGRFYDYARITSAYQFLQEERINRRFNNLSERTQQERVQVASLNADFTKELTAHTLRYGAEVLQNWVASDAWRIDVDTGERTERPDQTRYPAGGATQFTVAAYASHRWELQPGMWLSSGVRYTWTRVENIFRDGVFVPLPGFFDQTETTVGALTGNVGMVYVPNQRWRFAAQASSGFRAPNVNDLGKFFDSRPGDVGDGLVVPNPAISPERTWNLEATVQYSIPGRLLLSANGFYTWIDDLISLGTAQYQGLDTVEVDATKYRVYSYQNLTRARILGLSGEVRYLPDTHWELTGQVVYTHGRVTSPQRTPLSHIPPAYAQIGVGYQRPRWRLQASGTIHAWKPIDEYQLNAEDNEGSATPAGTPNWWKLDLRGEVKLLSRVTLQLAVENLLDQHYRPFASDVSAPGRNFLITLRTGF